MKSILKKIFISFFAIVTLIIGTGVAVGVFYEDEVTNAIVKELNKNIATDIKVGKISFSILSKFPDASIEFNNITALSTSGFEGISSFEDTLFTAKSVFLQFNVFDIIRKHYTLNAIHVHDADVRVITNSDGAENFHFWRSDTTQSDNFQLKLQHIKLTKSEVVYVNRIKKIDLKISTKKFSSKGDFTSNSYVLNSKGSFNFDKLIIDNVNYATKDNITLNADIIVDDYDLEIKKGKLRAEDLVFVVNGKANIKDKLNLDINISGENIDVNSLLSTIPAVYRKDIDKFNSQGEFFINANITGELSNVKSPHLQADFGVENGSISNSDVNLTLNNIHVKGKWSNGNMNSSRTSFLIVDSVNARLNNSVIAGSYSITNFIHPRVEMNFNVDAELDELINFIGIDTIESVSGTIKSKLSFYGNFNSFKGITNQEISRAKKNGYVFINDCNIKLKGVQIPIKNISGGFNFNNKNVVIDSLNFSQGVNDIKIEGFLYNLFDYLLVDNKDLRISGVLKSDNLDVDELIAINHSSDTNNKEVDLNIKDYINYNLQFYVNKIKFKKFVGENLRGRYKYVNNTISLSDFSVNTMDGVVTGNIELKEIDSTLFKLNASTNIKSVDINTLFYTFDNFGQDFITTDNLKGNISAENSFSFNMNEKMKINQKSLVLEANVVITNGELIEFKPIYSLSKFIELEELRNIKFSKLENTIYIKDEKILIPRMNVKSSAFDIDIEGRHSFAGAYEYSLKLLLSDFLSNKARKAKRENTEFGVVEDDGLGRTSLFLKIKGNGNDAPEISYDKTRVKEHLSGKVKDEKQNIKQILNEEFGWFKKDSAVVKQKEQTKEVPKKKKKKVQIQWEDN